VSVILKEKDLGKTKILRRSIFKNYVLSKQERRALRFLLAYLFVLLTLSFVDIASGGDPQLWRKVTDAGHFPAYFLLSLLLFPILEDKFGTGKAIFSCLIISAVIAGMIEIIQPYFSRSGSISDFLVGMSGAFCGLLWIYAEPQGFKNRIILRSFSLIFSCTVTVPLVLAVWEQGEAIWLRGNVFPKMFSAEHMNEMLILWRPTGSKNYASSVISSSTDGLKVTAIREEDPGIEFRAGDADWSKYKTLHLKLIAPNPIDFKIRIDDAKSNSNPTTRYSQIFPNVFGEKEIEISLQVVGQKVDQRQLNLRNIRRVIIFSPKMKKGSLFYLKEIELW
jgi:VanZ family protein